MKAKDKAQEWTLLLKKKKELQTSTEDLEITACTVKNEIHEYRIN